jgi:aminopeptidase N
VPQPIILDWRKIAGHEKDSTVSNVEINGQKVLSASFSSSPADVTRADARTQNYEESNEHLIFRDGVVPGENVIKLDFTSPILTSGSAITRYIDKEDGSEYIYSLFVPSDASTAFPVFDQPDLKARFELIITVPYGWKVISNSAEQDYGRLHEDGNQKIVRQGYFFEETKPISSYVFAFAAGEFSEFRGEGPATNRTTRDFNASLDSRSVALSRVAATNIYVRKSQAEKLKQHAPEVFRLTREGIKYLEEYFDYKFPFPKYDIVLIPEFPFGGMEHAGATFLREDRVIFPTEPTANDHITRANVIFHEAAHQWFGDTVTMRWFDDLWLKEGFAEFMAYKTLEKVMPQYNAWKAFYERNKQAAYLTDSTKGTTPIYQPIDNLSAAKSAYGNIVYRKAPSFLRQAEFYLGPDKFQTAVRTFLKKHEFANATWQDLVREFEAASRRNLNQWANSWVKQPGVYKFRVNKVYAESGDAYLFDTDYENSLGIKSHPYTKFNLLAVMESPTRIVREITLPNIRKPNPKNNKFDWESSIDHKLHTAYLFPNFQDYGYGIFLLDPLSVERVAWELPNEKDDFLRSMMWGALWDSVREAELDPRQYVELAIKDLPTEKDETITASVLNRVSTAMTYYMSDAERVSSPHVSKGSTQQAINVEPLKAMARSTLHSLLQTRLEAMLIDRMRTAPTLGQRITYYRAFLNIVSTENGRNVLKEMLKTRGGNLSGSQGATRPRGTLPTGRVSASPANIPLKTKDRFDIVTRLAILNDPDAPKILADLEKSETSDDAKRYAYAARAAFPTKENREKFWNDFVTNKDISESWIESAIGPFNSPRHSDLSLPYLTRALNELPNLKRSRKIFFINGWLGAFIGGQKSQEALDIVNKFLADNPNLDRDLRLKILENVDVIERAVKIRGKFSKN